MRETALTREQILEAGRGGTPPLWACQGERCGRRPRAWGKPWECLSALPQESALRDAVTKRWLGRISSALSSVAAEQRPAAERLQRWLDLLVHSKALDDPELFDTYIELAAEAREVVNAHVDTLLAQLTRIISEGVATRTATAYQHVRALVLRGLEARHGIDATG